MPAPVPQQPSPMPPETPAWTIPDTPALTADVIIPYQGGIVVIRRRYSPFKDKWCLPGGFVHVGESIEETAIREAEEETGLAVELVRLVGIYSAPGRDPRGATASACYLARVIGGALAADTDALHAEVISRLTADEMGFDHAEMCRDAGVLVL